jgi:signal transduction histidine kinase
MSDATEIGQPRRRSWWPQTVRVRLTIIATLVFAVTISAAAFGLVRLVKTNLVNRIQDTNQQQLNALTAQAESGAFQPSHSGHVYAVMGPDGRIQCCLVDPPSRSDVYQSERDFEAQGQRITLVAQRSVDEVTSTVSSVTDVLVVVVPLLIILVALAAWYFTGRALKPVEAIRLQAESITGTTMHRRVPEPDTDDEVGRLARTMNAMLARLETSAQKQRQFVSDASHELRSPLASIRTNLEVALHNADRTDWPEVAQRALAEDVRMEDTVSELLDLARLDEAEGPAPLESLPDVDLDELVLDDTVQERRVPVDTSRVSAGRVHGRREQLQRVVRNLLDNAARHATSMVAVALQSTDDVVELTVDDDGPGIRVEDRGIVFERFTRLDDGRARDAGGLGLGLAMVKAITEHHGGTVVVDDAPLGGARLRVTLPAA